MGLWGAEGAEGGREEAPVLNVDELRVEEEHEGRRGLWGPEGRRKDTGDRSPCSSHTTQGGEGTREAEEIGEPHFYLKNGFMSFHLCVEGLCISEIYQYNPIFTHHALMLVGWGPV